MKRTTGSLGLRALGLTGCLIMLGWLSPGPGSTAVQKVDVCHREGNGSFHLITVASQAVQAHRTHGDTLPGEAVPGTPGYVFDETCMEEPASTCPCDFSVGALANEGIDMQTMAGGRCEVNTTGIFILNNQTLLQADTPDALTGGRCRILSMGHAPIEIDSIAISQAQECVNDLLNAAQFLGLTCQ